MKSIKNNQSGFTLPELMIFVYFLVVICAIIGWIANIVRLAGCNFDVIGAEIVLRIVGIFLAPMGAILGFFGHF
jgi:hypothetical protein